LLSSIQDLDFMPGGILYSGVLFIQFSLELEAEHPVGEFDFFF